MIKKYCESCSMELLSSIRMCPNCGSRNFLQNKSDNQPTSTYTATRTQPKSSNLSGIGGWLILLAIGLIVGSLKLIFEVITLYKPYIKDPELITSLTNPTSEKYIEYFAPTFYSEILFNIFFIIYMAYLLYLFFTKRKIFIKSYIAISLFQIFYLPINSMIAATVMPELNAFDKETINNIVKAVLSAVIWIPYLLKSQRVKNTFTQ